MTRLSPLMQRLRAAERDLELRRIARRIDLREALTPSETLRDLVRRARTGIGTGVVRAEVWLS